MPGSELACRNIVGIPGQELGNRDIKMPRAGPSGKPRVPNCNFDIIHFRCDEISEISEIKDMLDQCLVLGLSLPR